MPSALSVRSYAFLSVAAGVMVVLSKWMQHEQLYPTLVALSNSKAAIVALSNVAIAAAIGMGYGAKQFFLGTLRENEAEHLSEKAYPMILDLLLTVTLFRTSLSISFFAMLGALMISKCFHWLVIKRVEYMGQTPLTQLSTYIRLGVLMVLLVALDILVVVKSAQAVLIESKGLAGLFLVDHTSEGPSIYILYGFEFAVLTTMMLGAMVRSFLIAIEMVSYLGRWDEKSTYVMYTDFVVDVFQFGIYAIFFLTLYAHVGLPITLVRPLLVAFSNFRKRVGDLMRYRQATQNMEERFPEATTEELAGAHNMCIICREEMTNGKKLPCGHVLHLRCLREWLEHQQTCPTCRVPVIGERAAPHQAPQQAPQGFNNPFFGPMPPNAQAAQRQGQAQANANAFGQDQAAAANGAQFQGFQHFHVPVPGQVPLGPFGPMPAAAHPFFHNAMFAPFPQHPGFYQAQQQAPVPPRPESSAAASPAASSTSSTPQAQNSITSSSTLAPVDVHQPASPTTNSTVISSSATPDSLSAASFPADVIQDILELVSSMPGGLETVTREIDSLKARLDILTALVNAHLRSPVPPSVSAPSPTPSAPVPEEESSSAPPGL